MINATSDICGFLNGTKNEVLTKYIIEIIGHHMPKGLLHPCPFVGYIECYGLNIIGESYHYWPDGVYTYALRLFNRKDFNILSVKIEVEVTGTGNSDVKF